MKQDTIGNNPTASSDNRLHKLYWFILAAGAFCVPFSYLNLPIPGGETKPLTAIFWFPVFVGLTARLIVTGRGNIVEFSLVGLLLLGLAWFPIIVASSLDFAEYIVRLIAYGAAVVTAVVAASLRTQRSIQVVLWSLLAGYSVVMIYSMILQVPGAVGIAAAADLDQSIREAILARARTWGQVTLLDAEPSFAAFELAGLLSLLIMFRYMLPSRVLLIFVLMAVVLMILAKSVTALALLFVVSTAWALRKGLRPTGVVGVMVLVLVLSALLVAFLEIALQFGPAARLANIQTDPSANARFFLATAAWNAGIYAEGFGIGPGQFSARWSEFLPVDQDIINNLPKKMKEAIGAGTGKVKPFSVLGGLFGEFGLVGLLLLAVLLINLLWRTLRATRADGWTLAILIVLVIVVFNGAYPPSLPVFWLVIGLMHAKLNLEQPVYHSARPSTNLASNDFGGGGRRQEPV